MADPAVAMSHPPWEAKIFAYVCDMIATRPDIRLTLFTALICNINMQQL